MRKLKVKDIAPAIKLANAIDCGKELKAITESTNDPNKAGVEIIGLILTRYGENPVAERKLAEFLSGPFEMSADDILEMNVDDFINSIKEIGGISAFVNFFGKSLA